VLESLGGRLKSAGTHVAHGDDDVSEGRVLVLLEQPARDFD
jgi:hypothetical protein